MLVQCNLHMSMYLLSAPRPRTKSSPKMACRSNFRPFIKVLLSFFIRSRHFFLSLPLFLSFIPGLSHTTTQTAASSHLLTDADDVGSGGGCAAGYYDTNNYATVHTLVSIPLIRCTLGRLIHLKLVSTCRAYRRRDGVLTYGVSSFEMQDTAQLLIKLSSCRYSR